MRRCGHLPHSQPVYGTGTPPATVSRSVMQNQSLHPAYNDLRFRNQRGRVGWILLWLVGLPAPILLGVFLVKG